MSRFTCGGILTALAALAVAIGPLSPRAAAKTDGTPKSTDNDPFRVPDGTIDELQKYIEGLKNLPPPSSLRPAGAEFRRKRASAELAASEKIIAASLASGGLSAVAPPPGGEKGPVRPTPEQVRFALRSKVAALTMLERLGDGTAAAKTEATVQQAWKLAAPPTAPPQQPTPTQRPPAVVREVMLAIIEGRAPQAATMNAQQYSRLIKRLTEYLKVTTMDDDDARLAAELAMAGEEHQTRETAIATYRELAAVLAASNDVPVASAAATLLGAARRLELAGKPFVLQGVTLGGRAIDVKKYKGKVVLVDVFTTWCGPCRDEIPNITKCYRAYRKRGFEVLGVSLDRDRKTIADFLEKEKYPWTVLLDRYEARGTDKSLATYYGIFTIPQMVLVGKDGRVLALDVRGQRLNKALAEQLGPAEDAESKKAAAVEQAKR